MNLSTKKVIYRIKPLHMIAKGIMRNSGYFTYKKLYRERNLADIFTSLKDSELGKRCFIIGNGPSLTPEDLTKLTNEDCFGSNMIFHMFDKTVWRPKYYLLIDRYCPVTSEDINKLEVQNVFIGDYYWKHHQINRNDAIPLHQHYSAFSNTVSFSDDISKCIYITETVSYGLMQIAVYLGYREIILLGFDHNYALEKNKKGAVVQTDKKASHFYTDEDPNSVIADMNGMTRSYVAFKKYADEHDIIVRNATRGGKLEVFERVDFDSLF